MVAGALLGASGAGGGTSLQGGTSGPAKSGITSDNSFNIGGNAGIGSSSGGLLNGLVGSLTKASPQALAVIGLIAIALVITFTRGKR